MKLIVALFALSLAYGTNGLPLEKLNGLTEPSYVSNPSVPVVETDLLTTDAAKSELPTAQEVIQTPAKENAPALSSAITTEEPKKVIEEVASDATPLREQPKKEEELKKPEEAKREEESKRPSEENRSSEEKRPLLEEKKESEEKLETSAEKSSEEKLEKQPSPLQEQAAPALSTEPTLSLPSSAAGPVSSDETSQSQSSEITSDTVRKEEEKKADQLAVSSEIPKESNSQLNAQAIDEPKAVVQAEIKSESASVEKTSAESQESGKSETQPAEVAKSAESSEKTPEIAKSAESVEVTESARTEEKKRNIQRNEQQRRKTGNFQRTINQTGDPSRNRTETRTESRTR